jgi:hypothetical protein
VNVVNPSIYPFYENFLNSSFVYRGPIVLATTSKTSTSISLLTIIHNLSLTLLGITLDDFECEKKYLSLTSEQCYDIRLTVRRMTYLWRHHHYTIEYPLNNIDKQIIIHLIHSIVSYERTYDVLKPLLDLYMKHVHGYSQVKVKHLLYNLLLNSSLNTHAIQTIGRFIELNRFEAKLLLIENKNPDDDLWLHSEQIRLVTHQLYSNDIYENIFLPMINGDCREHRTLKDLLIYLDDILAKVATN